MKQNKWLKLAQYFIYLLIFYILFKAKINDTINPFTFGVYFALIWCNQNILALSSLYIGASYISNFNLFDLYSAIFMCVVMCIIYGIHYKLKKPIKPMLMLVYALICSFLNVFLKIYSGQEIWIVFVELVFGLLYMFSCMKIFESVVVRGFSKRLTMSQVICLSMFLVSISCGLCYFNFYEFSVIKFALMFCILFSSLVLPMFDSLLVSMVFSLGTALYDNNPYLIAPSLIIWLGVNCFRGKHRVFGGLALIVCDVLCNYYFNFYYTNSYLVLIPSVLTFLICLCIPKKYYVSMIEKYNSSFCKRSTETLINRNRKTIYKKLNNLSQIFAEMDKVYRSMIKDKTSESDLKTLMLTETKGMMCSDCENKSKCLKQYSEETNKILANLINVGYEKGRVTLLDIPSVLTSRCFKVNQMVYEINNLLEQYKSYAQMVNSLDSSKILISEQLYGISTVMKNLSNDIGKNVDFDKGMEKEIIDELLYNDILCSDAIVYHDTNDVNAVLEVKNEDSLKSKIVQVVSKVCNTKMSVETENVSEHAGWKILNLKPAPKYNVIFGTSAMTKSSSQKSGDCYSIVRMEDGKILMALCDGMGSGEKAQKASETAIGLIENFYKAGFENEVILSIVNKFLALGNDNIFSCLDMSIIDLKTGGVDFIKLGATNGYIKHKDTISTISCNALPLGIVSNIVPTIKSSMLYSGDMIVITTDGVTDSFASDEEMANYINNINSYSPQEVADKLMDKAVENNHGIALDDMTILVAKVY